jgi:acyl-coenzyme A thioesterase PaaI-like protein
VVQVSGAFSVATAVADMGGGVFHCGVAEGWDINGNANGGYLLAMTGRAMARAAGRPDPVSVTGHYLSPGKVGPAEVVAHVVKSGKRFATVAATLQAGGRPIIAALGTFGDLSQASDRAELVDGTPPDLPPPEACIPRSASHVTVNFSNRLDMRLHPEDATFGDDLPSGRALVRGWFRLHDGEPLDTTALLCCVDAFPPTAFNALLPRGWTPTIELTAHVRARPAPGWLRCRFSTRFVTGDLLEEDGEVWDAQGRLVAQSRQLALLSRL